MSEFLKIGYFVKLGELFYKITGTEPFKYATGEGRYTEFTAVLTGAESGWKDIEALEPSNAPPHIYQVRPGVKDGCKYYFQLPTGTHVWGIDEDKDVGYIDSKLSPHYAKNDDYEFFLTHDHYPRVNADNATGQTVTPKVYFEGMKYDYTEAEEDEIVLLAERRLPYREIRVGGIKTAG